MKKTNIFEELVYFSRLFGRAEKGLPKAQNYLCLMVLFLLVSSAEMFGQTYWAASGGSILNVDTGTSYTGPGALTEAHDDAATLDGHTLMFMPAGLDIFSTDVFDTDHDATFITKAVIIDGNGATVKNDSYSNNSNALRLFPQLNETITVQNITLCSFSGSNGSAISSTQGFTGTKLVLENVNVYDSYENSYAVWLEGSCDVINCDFSNVLQTSNTGGLNIVLQRELCTVNIVDSNFDCNRKF